MSFTMAYAGVLIFALVAISFPPVAAYRFHETAHHHVQHVKRDQAPLYHTLVKRSEANYTGRGTFYDAGLGACGRTNTASDLIVALNQDQYTANKWCFKKIRITANGITCDAEIVDMCPGCPFGALDMSKALFHHFAEFDAGVIYVKWHLLDGSDESATPVPAKTPEKPPPPPPPPVLPPAPELPKPETKKPVPVPEPKPLPNPKPDYKPDPKPDLKPDPTLVQDDPEEPIKTQPDNPPLPSVTSKPVTVSTKPIPNPMTPNPSRSGLTKPDGTVDGSLNVAPVKKAPPVTAPPQPPSTYATGGNLDAINQLVIVLGGMTVASAQNAIQS